MPVIELTQNLGPGRAKGDIETVDDTTAVLLINAGLAKEETTKKKVGS